MSMFVPDPLAHYAHALEYYFVNISDHNDTDRHFLTPGPFWSDIALRGPPGAHHWPDDR
jgi:hypothetical protein